GCSPSRARTGPRRGPPPAGTGRRPGRLGSRRSGPRGPPPSRQAWSSLAPSLESRGECLGRLLLRRCRGPLQGTYGLGLVEVEDGVELARQAGVEVMAGPLGLRAVDHADGALQTCAVPLPAAAQGEEEARQARGVEHRLPAAGQRGTHALALRGPVPLRGRGHRAGVRREADEHGRSAVALADELAHVQLAPLAPLRGPRVAEV